LSGGGKTIDAEPYLKLAKRLGAEAAFTKPFLPIELVKEVKKMLDETD